MTLKNCFFIFLLSIILVSCSRKQSSLFLYPPNTKPLVNGKFLDVSYIECLHVLEFLYSLQKDFNSQELYKRIKPKTDSLTFGQYTLNYTDYRFRLYPMPVSQEFAIEYCKWRSEIVTHEMNGNSPNRNNLTYSEIIKLNKKAKVIIKYSIPTIQDLQTPYRNKTGFKKYDKKFLTYDVLSQEAKETKKLYVLRCIATVER